MGTTLALNGAYILAGTISKHGGSNLEAAFDEYEAKMRPLVQVAQKLVPGLPWIMHPETEWGIWVMNALLGVMSWTKAILVLFKWVGPPAGLIPVENFGFEQLPEFVE